MCCWEGGADGEPCSGLEQPAQNGQPCVAALGSSPSRVSLHQVPLSSLPGSSSFFPEQLEVNFYGTH